MRGEITKRILELISETAISIPALMEAVLESGYGASPRKMQRNFKRIVSAAQEGGLNGYNMRRDRQRYYNFIYHLKKDGLIAEGGSKDGTGRLLKLTPAGRQRLKILKSLVRVIPRPKYDKNGKNDASPSAATIVVFDVPEKDRRKRAWLRAALEDIGMKIIQKSVWFGKVKIPGEFIDDLAVLGLIEYVQIFQVSKTGSLSQLTR